MGHCLRSRVGTGYQTQHSIQGHDGRTAVADERQGQADNGHGADAHADVDDHLEDQSRGSAEADQTPHIVGAANTHINTPGDNGKLQNHDSDAAEETQLLTDGGEDVVRMLGEEGAALGTVAVEQALTGQTAAGEGPEVHHIVEPFVGTLGVNGVVEKNQDTVSLVLTKELPQNREGCRNTADGQGKPQKADTAGESHADKDEYEDQGNTCVGGNGHVQANHDAQMQHHLHDRGDTGYAVFIGVHDRCHDHDKGDLADLCRLDINDGGMDPASVAGVIISAERNQHQQHENIKQNQKISVFAHNFRVDGGNDGKHHQSQNNAGTLDQNVTHTATEFIGLSGADHADHAKAGSNQTQQKQHPVTLLWKTL